LPVLSPGFEHGGGVERMKLAILTQYYPPEIGAPQSRLSALAREFIHRGHHVTVLTAMPNYPTGKLHTGYRKMFLREERDGVRVLRSFIWPTQKADFPRRLASYLSFVLSAALLGSASLEPPDYLLVESPPLFLGLTGVLLGRLKRTRTIFNVSDLWPESAVRLGLLQRSSASYRLGAWLEGFCYRHAWLVTGQSAEIISDVSARFPSSKTLHLSNGVDSEAFGPERATSAARDLLGKNGNCVALYAGLHGIAQGLELLVDAAASVSSSAHLDVILMGDGPRKLAIVDRVNRRRIRGVRFLDSRPHRDMPAILAAADVLVVPLLRYIPGAVPSKLYEAMASGRPVVLIGDGEAAHILRQHDAGICVTPGDVVGLVRALKALSSDAELRAKLGANGRAAAVRFFDRRRIVAPFIDFLERHLPTAISPSFETVAPRSRPQPVPPEAEVAAPAESLSR
jgi:glycosyltransferase involved in cell wall biosynthesis